MRYMLLLSAICLSCWAGAAQASDWGDAVLPVGRDYVVPEECGKSASDPQLYQHVYAHVVYLNFDGAQLKQGGNNSANNETSLILVPSLQYPAQDWSQLGGPEQGKAAVLEELRLLFLGYALDFVLERPAAGDYTMAMIGGEGKDCDAEDFAVGIAPMDCKDLRKNEVCLIYGDKLNNSVKQLAYVIAHELGHTFGLEHISDETGIMYPALSSSTAGWGSGSLTDPTVCQRTSQDSNQVLLDNLGLGPGDTIPPRIWFMRPGPGAVLPPNFSFEVTAVDDLRVHHVEVFVDDVKELDLLAPPYTSALRNVADGEHVIRAQVHDWNPDNVTQVEVRVTVDRGCIEAGTCVPGDAGFNAECDSGDACQTGLCATSGAAGQCVDLCEEAAPVCPGELTCQQNTDTWACLPAGAWSLSAAGEGGGDDGGCSVAVARGNAPWPRGLALLPGLLLALLFLRRRRAR